MRRAHIEDKIYYKNDKYIFVSLQLGISTGSPLWAYSKID